MFSHKTYNVDVFSGEHDRLGVMAVVSSLAYASFVVVMFRVPLLYSLCRRDFAMRQLIFGNQVGVVTAVLAEDPSQLFRDIYDIRPRALSGVPRFWQAVQAEYERELQALTEAVLKASSASTLGEEEKRALEEKALRTTREKLGGKLPRPCSHLLLRSHRICQRWWRSSLAIAQALAGAALSRRRHGRLCDDRILRSHHFIGFLSSYRSGIYSDNRVMEGVDVKLVDWEEYTSRDLPFPRGEVRSFPFTSPSRCRSASRPTACSIATTASLS